MQNFVLFDVPEIRKQLLPLTYFRAVARIRSGILQMQEKWEKTLQKQASVCTEDYLMPLYKNTCQASDIFIASHIYPGTSLAEAINTLDPHTALYDKKGNLLAFRTNKPLKFSSPEELLKNIPVQRKEWNREIKTLERPYDLILANAEQITEDLKLLHPDETSKGNYKTAGDYPLYVEDNKPFPEVFFDLSEGPVYIEKNVTILPFSYIKGPVALLEGSVVKAGTRIYNGTTLGPQTKTGGEIKNVLFFGYSNKGHDGYLGDAVVGEWCNIGAGTSNSNLKNNYSPVRIWNYARKDFEDTGRTFLGLVMGDHSKIAINTSINTGTVIGVSANVFTRGFPPKFIPSFNWGGDTLNHDYELSKAMETARKVMERRGMPFTDIHENIFRTVYYLSAEE